MAEETLLSDVCESEVVSPEESGDREYDAFLDGKQPSLDLYGLACLCLQHSSSSFGDRLAEFAFPLYLVELFPGTLLPASIYGFVVTIFGILFSGSVASLIDFTPRLKAVRLCILGQKISVLCVYALFLIMFSKSDAHHFETGPQNTVWLLYAGVILGGVVLKLATVGINVAVERDWALQISQGLEGNLTRINIIMYSRRRVDLLSNLIAPIFVSILTTAGSYKFSTYFLMTLSFLSALFEFIWIEVVYRRFPMLEEEPPGRPLAATDEQRNINEPITQRIRTTLRAWPKGLRTWLKVQRDDWQSFASYPVFMSSVAISLLYLSALSFDPTFLSYLKNTTDFSDLFISAMRGICVLTGLIGTFIVPILQRTIGLTRAGSWSIGAEFLCLCPTLLTFYIGATHHRPVWNTVLLFTGIALSRIGLWAFDVVQLTQLQTALATHPRRNALTGIHFALQNLFDLAHYSVTIAWSAPKQFKYAAAVSCCSVFLAFMVYLFGYARRLRGHLLHLEYLYHFFLERKTLKSKGFGARLSIGENSYEML